MNKKTLIIAGGSILGVLIVLLVVLWLITVFKHKYFTYETVEEKITEATNKYYKKFPEMLPAEDGRYNLQYSVLVENELIKPLNELLKDGDNCSAIVDVIKNSDNYSYVPRLNCGDSYNTKEFYTQILNDNEIVTSGSGLYKDEDGTYYFKGKINNNYVSFGTITEKKETSEILWQIISINNDNTIKIKAINSNIKSVYDNRYNVDRKSNTGYNDFEMSILKETLKALEEDNTFLGNAQRAKLVSKNLCIASRTTTDTTKNGSTECMKTTSEPMLFGTMLPYEYLRASLDENCNKIEDKSCSNFNFLANTEQKTEWSITASPDNSYQAYSFNGNYYDVSTTKNNRTIYVTANLNEFAFYKSGSGTKTDPYKIK